MAGLVFPEASLPEIDRSPLERMPRALKTALEGLDAAVAGGANNREALNRVVDGGVDEVGDGDDSRIDPHAAPSSRPPLESPGGIATALEAYAAFLAECDDGRVEVIGSVFLVGIGDRVDAVMLAAAMGHATVVERLLQTEAEEYNTALADGNPPPLLCVGREGGDWWDRSACGSAGINFWVVNRCNRLSSSHPPPFSPRLNPAHLSPTQTGRQSSLYRLHGDRRANRGFRLDPRRMCAPSP